MKIKSLKAVEIFNCLGEPTVECILTLDNDVKFKSSVPIGTLKGKYEAFDLRDKTISGSNVSSSVHLINEIIAPEFLDKEPDAINMDFHMLEMDSLKNKNILGANSTLAVSMVLYKAQAFLESLELFEFIANVMGNETVSLPIPMLNFINGGLHSNSNLDFQEYLAIPLGAQTFKQSIELSHSLFSELGNVLKNSNKDFSICLEGGYSANFDSVNQPFELILKSIENLGLEEFFALGLDTSASSFFSKTSKKYILGNKQFSNLELINVYVDMVNQFNLYSIEDGLDQDDWQGWRELNNALGENIKIVADDLFATNIDRIINGIEQNAANSVIIKPNQIGTITESLQAIKLCHESELMTIVSHCSGDMSNTFIADLAVGANATHIKFGGLHGSERLANYNRLIEIEDFLINS